MLHCAETVMKCSVVLLDCNMVVDSLAIFPGGS